MRKKNKEITGPDIIQSIIQKATYCRLAMCLDNMPYIVTMNFGYKDNALYFHCAPEGKKIDILLKNPNVCFEMAVDTELIAGDHACKWDTQYKSIIGYGTAEILREHQEKTNGLDVLMSHYATPPFEYKDQAVDKAVIIKVTITEMTGKQN